MTPYKAPLQDICFLLFKVFQTDQFWKTSDTFKNIIDKNTANSILQEGAKITENTISLLSQHGDESGCYWKNGKVSTPSGYQKAFQKFADGGWISLSGDPTYGGMGMPYSLDMPINEMLSSADLSFSLYPGLTSGASLTLLHHADENIKRIFLPKLYQGEFSGTMCLTESHAGSDLGMIKTKAKQKEKNIYYITGTKNFITAGEHDLTKNIVHLVLAKLPNAPDGTKGISMFLVSKYKISKNGILTDKLNGVHCNSIESKMGIKASATCVMQFDQSEGILIGEINKGLQCMFTMMNSERLFVGLQGLACAERSYQNSVAYAKERIQGRSALGAQQPDKNADPIIVHGDIRHMLLSMKAMNEAGRAFAIYLSTLMDETHFSNSTTCRNTSGNLVSLLTPVAKSFLSDNGFSCCTIGQQIFGGHGYIKDFLQEQLVRDVRITQIYEGTNGIQAMDLLGRKIIKDNGETFKLLSNTIKQFLKKNKNSEFHNALYKAVKRIDLLTEYLIKHSKIDPNIIGSSCTDYMRSLGYLLYAWMWARMITVSEENIRKNSKNSDFYEIKIVTARHFFERLLPALYASSDAAQSDAKNIFVLNPDRF